MATQALSHRCCVNTNLLEAQMMYAVEALACSARVCRSNYKLTSRKTNGERGGGVPGDRLAKHVSPKFSLHRLCPHAAARNANKVGTEAIIDTNTSVNM